VNEAAGVRMTGAMHLLLHTRLHDLHRANFTSKTQTFKNSYESSLWDLRAYENVQGESSIMCVLLGISPASGCDLPTFRNPLSVQSSKAGCRVLSGW
jgi:hypothetical protein